MYFTSTGGEFVLRGVLHYDWQLPAERFFARALHERTMAPVPWPYLVDPAEDIFGWSYALMPRMRLPSDPDLTLREWVEPYLAEAGALLAAAAQHAG